MIGEERRATATATSSPVATNAAAAAEAAVQTLVIAARVRVDCSTKKCGRRAAGVRPASTRVLREAFLFRSSTERKFLRLATLASHIQTLKF